MSAPAICHNGQAAASDPEAAKLITSGIDSFWRAYDTAFGEAGLAERGGNLPKENMKISAARP